MIKAKTSLFPWQEKAFNHVRSVRVSGLFMEMGLGKTRTAIELVLHRQNKIKRVVWFTPVSLMTTAVEEFKKHTDISDAQIYEFSEHTTAQSMPKDAFLYVVGLESMGSSNRVVLSVAQLIDDKTFVLVDESSYIKGHLSKRTARITRLGERSRYRTILTGTPLTQGVVDLYAQMRFLSHQILGYQSFYSFAANHLEYSAKHPDMIVRAHNTTWLAKKIAPYVYQCTKDEVLDLPEKRENTVWHRISSEQAEAYGRAKEEILARLDKDEHLEVYIIFQLFNALRQIISGFWNRYDDKGNLIQIKTFENNRLPRLLETVDGIGEKLIVWTEYQYSTRQIANALKEAYGDTAVAQHHGQMSRQQRDDEIRKWRKSGRVLVATTGTGGYGLNLTEASQAIFYEHQFKYAHRVQAEDRIHRIGQKRKVMYTNIMCAGSIDARILRSLADKENVAERFRRQLNKAKGDRNSIRQMILDL